MSTASSSRIGRNAACPCGSGGKFKRCHGRSPNSQLIPMLKQLVDSGEEPVRWVLANSTGTSFFVDKQGRIMTFADRQVAIEVARMTMFESQEEYEINIAGIGPTKWQHLQEQFPFIEVAGFEMAEALIKERIADQQAQLGLLPAAPESVAETTLSTSTQVAE